MSSPKTQKTEVKTRQTNEQLLDKMRQIAKEVLKELDSNNVYTVTHCRCGEISRISQNKRILYSVSHCLVCFPHFTKYGGETYVIRKDILQKDPPVPLTPC